MIIKVNHRKNPFVMVDKGVMGDKRLSFKARGIIAYCMTLPSHLRLSMQHLEEASTDGKWAIQSAFRELRKYGYAQLQSLRHKNGQIFGQQWVLSESPITPENDTESRKNLS